MYEQDKSAKFNGYASPDGGLWKAFMQRHLGARDAVTAQEAPAAPAKKEPAQSRRP